MPNPSDYSDKQKWMEDCMHQTKTVEKKPQDQAVAICLNRWREKGKKASIASRLRGVAREIAMIDDAW